jgi:hypothetical protein
MTLRGSQHKGDATLAAILEIASEAAEPDPTGYRKEFLSLVQRAKELRGE